MCNVCRLGAAITLISNTTLVDCLHRNLHEFVTAFVDFSRAVHQRKTIGSYIVNVEESVDNFTSIRWLFNFAS